jgi:hypothetical protein
LRAFAIHTHLAFADDALDMTERKTRKAHVEEAVDAHARFVGSDGDGLDATTLNARQWLLTAALPSQAWKERCRAVLFALFPAIGIS